MVITSSGNFKKMVGQVFKNAQSSSLDLNLPDNGQERDGVTQNSISPGNSAPTQPVNTPGVQTPGVVTSPASNDNAPEMGQEVKGEEENDIAKIVINALISWGWPQRHVIKYRKNMVKEKTAPSETGSIKKDITITATNTHYGKDKMISDQDFTKLVRQIENFAKIRWIGGNRGGDVMSINFSSDIDSTMVDPADEKLEKIYGKQPGVSKEKSAMTLGEMITARKDSLYKQMREIVQRENSK